MASAISEAIGSLMAVAGFCLVLAGAGSRVLRWIGIESKGTDEYLLCAVGVGVALFELACLVAAVLGRLRTGLWLSIGALVILAILEGPRLAKNFRELSEANRSTGWSAKLVAAAFLGVVLYAGLAAMAPLTGSDALHYHFAEPRLMLLHGYYANFYNTHSFLLGQGHLLILAGLALGSEKFALGLLWLGGVLTALAGACLARRWMPATGAWLVALAFVISPVVFWQMSTAGAPDMWIAFYTTMCVLLIVRGAKGGLLIDVALAGAFAGQIAGAKYTGCIIAASLAVALMRETRAMKPLFVFVGSALGVGIWPYLRNAIWTGDPVFPFFMDKLYPARVNAEALAALVADTRSNIGRGLWVVLKFPLFAGLESTRIGLWQFLGPVCLALAPLVFLAWKKTALWRVVVTTWIISALAIGMTSGLLRFTVPVMALGLAAVMAGVWSIPREGWKVVRFLAWSSIGLFLALSAGGLFFYALPAVKAAVGLTSKEAYLQAVAPDEKRIEFVNASLRGRQGQGNALVFMRHTYYLQVPYVTGNPAESWAVDATKLQDEASWSAFFERENIYWVVKAPEYPPTIAGALNNLEKRGILKPVAETMSEDITGKRLDGTRVRYPVVILEVQKMAGKP
jgi:hypothetical protein